MANPADFDETVQALRSILVRHAPPLVVTSDGKDGFSMDIPRPDLPGPKRFAAGMRRGKTYVSFYLMPVYVYPELLNAVSPALRKRMQGKSCFNFKSIDPTMLAELTELTERSVELYRSRPPL